MLRHFSAFVLVLAACSQPEAPGGLAGTQWRFAGTQRVVTFRADGTTAFSGLTTGGHWSQDGEQLVFDSNGFTEYRVTLTGRTLVGTWARLRGPHAGRSSPTSLQRL